MGYSDVRDAWRVSVWLALVVGGGAAVVVLPMSAVIMLVLCGAVFGATVAGIRCVESFPDRGPIASESRVALLAAAVCVGALGCLALAGLFAAFGPFAFAVLLVLALSSPPVRAKVRRSADPAAGEHVTARAANLADAIGNSQRPGTASDAELCRQWTSTQRKLTQPAFRLFVHALADVRAGILDELERRDPAAFGRWLASGTSGAGDPQPFFVGDGDTRPARGDAA